jgi:hypothetical protein
MINYSKEKIIFNDIFQDFMLEYSVELQKDIFHIKVDEDIFIKECSLRMSKFLLATLPVNKGEATKRALNTTLKIHIGDYVIEAVNETEVRHEIVNKGFRKASR